MGDGIAISDAKRPVNVIDSPEVTNLVQFTANSIDIHTKKINTATVKNPPSERTIDCRSNPLHGRAYLGLQSGGFLGKIVLELQASNITPINVISFLLYRKKLLR